MMVSRRGVLYISLIVGILSLVLVLSAQESRGVTYTVHTDGGGDFTNITEALDGTVDGDIIVLGPGHFVEERIVINRSISIIGSGIEKTRITALNGTEILADGVEISNLSVVRYAEFIPLCVGCSYPQDGGGITIRSNDTRLEDLVIDVNWIPLRLIGSDRTSLRNLELSFNVPHGLYIYWDHWQMEWLELIDSSSSTIQNIHLKHSGLLSMIDSNDNTLTGIDCGYVKIERSSFNVISEIGIVTSPTLSLLDSHENLFTSITAWQMILINSNANTIRTSSFLQSYKHWPHTRILFFRPSSSFHLEGSDQNVISGNIFPNLSHAITLNNSKRNSILGNLLLNAHMIDDSIGVHITNSDGNYLSDNRIMNSSVAIHLESSDRCSIEGNAITLVDRTAIVLDRSNSSIIHENRIIYARRGIRILQSKDCSITENFLFFPAWTLVGGNDDLRIIFRDDAFPDSDRSLYDLDQSGILVLSSDDALIHDNLIEEYSCGLHVITSNRSAITGNRFWDNHFGLTLEGNCSDPTIHGNTFWGNVKGIHLIRFSSFPPPSSSSNPLSSPSSNSTSSSSSSLPSSFSSLPSTSPSLSFPSAFLNVTENNWGHDSGPSHPLLNPGGQGDSFSDNFAFEPWLDRNGNLTYTVKAFEESSTPLFPPPPLLSFLLVILVICFSWLGFIVSLPADRFIVGSGFTAQSSFPASPDELSSHTSARGTDPPTQESDDLIICRTCGNMFEIDPDQPVIRFPCPFCGNLSVTKDFQ